MVTLNKGESKSVVIDSREYWNNTGIELKKGQQYLLKAEGKWVDLYIETDADGFDFFVPDIFRQLFKSFRRMPDENLFALIGSIDESPETEFHIGTGLTDYTPQKSGELVCFANDAKELWSYWNNFGSVNLTVTRKT